MGVLKEGEITVQGEFIWGSNYTFLAEVSFDGRVLPAVYKPTRGERPLWDFPTASLAKREVAAYLVSEGLDWGLVPLTVYRKKGPLGAGSLQLYVEHDPEYHYFNFKYEDLQRLKPTVLFDLLINNADRKGSHVLRGMDGHLWLIDHGLCFHVEDKLRTVIWDFVDQPIPEELCADILKLRHKLEPIYPDSSPFSASLLVYLSMAEVRALARRAENLVSEERFPPPDPNRRPYPWPQI
jgi:uncharacterized repeat protein (TIGR03843 family)